MSEEDDRAPVLAIWAGAAVMFLMFLGLLAHDAWNVIRHGHR